ncbi:hypothetical protein BGX28_004490 [Mortierella sp. GBA30]|nr:hypothetical protein BGX28_004490 [Mortierella sp. GBA30]
MSPLILNSSKTPRTLSDELSLAFQNTPGTEEVVRSRTVYPSPITPSDLLSIPDLSASSTTASSSSSSSSTSASPTALPLQRSGAVSPIQKSNSAGHKLRPSPLSINTSFHNGNNLDSSSFMVRPNAMNPGSPQAADGASDLRTPPLTRLPQSAANRQQHPHRSHRHQHHPSCHYHAPTHGSKHDRTNTFRSEEPASAPEHIEVEESELNASGPVSQTTDTETTILGTGTLSTSTAVAIVDSTPAFGVSAYRLRSQEDDENNNALGMLSTEPPKKRQRSIPAKLFGAAFETVIFTSAVALSAYQLLTGKGRQQLQEDGTVTSIVDGDDAMVAETNLETSLDQKLVLRIESAPMDIPTRTVRHRDSGQLGKSLHHNSHLPHHRSRQSRSNNKNRHGHGLSASLPHAYGYDHAQDAAMTLPGRPNTGTEDNDEQFLRMEAKLTNLIAEGKRALNSRIQDWAEESSKE